MDHLSAAGVPPQSDREHTGAIRILHVDDERELVDLTSTFLAREDERFVIETATDAAAALDRLEDGAAPLDGIVSDYDMPEMDGLELLESVRENYPDLPFILFTGKGSEEIASEAISAGVTEYMQKGRGTDQYAVLANRIRNAVDQYRAERAIETVQERFRRLVEETTDVIFVVAPDGTIEYATPSAERILGRSPEALIGSNSFELIHPEDRERATAEYAELAGNPAGRRSVEFRYQHPDGSWIWTEARGRNLLEDPVIEGIVVYARDITERRLREQELTETTRTLEAVVESSPVPIVVVGLDGLVELWNPAAEELFGWSETEVLGEPVPTVPDGAEETFEVRPGGAPDGEMPTDTAVRRRTKDGETLDLGLSTAPLRDADGGVVGFIAVFDERPERERALREKNERLDRFAGIVSHDLRNPLRVLEGSLELAEETGDRRHFERARSSVGEMRTLIDDLLRIARDGEVVGDRTAVDAAAVVESCWRPVGTPEATLRSDLDGRFLADERRFRQLVENLFRNCVEHAGKGVTVRVGPLADGEGFYVADDGPGIPADEREAVFDSGGGGLGLSIVRRIAQAHGWDVSAAESAAGGARFEIRGVERPGDADDSGDAHDRRGPD